MSYWIGLVVQEKIRVKFSECELVKVRGKILKVPLFAERKVCLEKELHFWNQHFISYKMKPILITFETQKFSGSPKFLNLLISIPKLIRVKFYIWVSLGFGFWFFFFFEMQYEFFFISILCVINA
jgi:hypothetical protein